MNVYQSVHNDPVNHIDPLGLETKPEGTNSSSSDQSFADWARTNNVSPDQPSISTEAIASSQAPEQIHYGSAPPVAQQALGMLVGAAQSLKDKLTQLAGTVFDAGNAAVRAASGGERGFTNGESTTNSFFHTAGAATEWSRTLQAQGETYLSVLAAFPLLTPMLRGTRMATAAAEGEVGSGATLSVPASPSELTAEESAQSIISRVAQQQADLGAEGLRDAGYFSRGQWAAYTANPAGGGRFLGTAVHESTADSLGELYPGRFLYNRVGPDFTDTVTGEVLELTTPGQVGAHMAKPGYESVTYSIYSLPSGG
jgi:hypothetical protein